MKVLLYGHDPKNGYSVLAGSRNFSPVVADYIRKLGSKLETPFDKFSSNAFSYRPMEADQNLLTVYLRHPVKFVSDNRASTTMVNYLLTNREADCLFQRDPVHRLKDYEQFAIVLENSYYDGTLDLDTRLQELDPPEYEDPIYLPFDSIPSNVIIPLSATSYSKTLCKNRDRKQAYIITKDSIVLNMISDMLMALPYGLRRKVSFHTGVESAYESNDIAVSFVKPDLWNNVNRTLTMTSPTKKFFYFMENRDAAAEDPETVRLFKHIISDTEHIRNSKFFRHLIMNCIDQWDDFLALDQVLESKDVSTALLNHFSEEKILDIADWNLLDSVEDLARSSTLIRYNEVYEVLKDRFPEEYCFHVYSNRSHVSKREKTPRRNTSKDRGRFESRTMVSAERSTERVSHSNHSKSYRGQRFVSSPKRSSSALLPLLYIAVIVLLVGLDIFCFFAPLYTLLHNGLPTELHVLMEQIPEVGRYFRVLMVCHMFPILSCLLPLFIIFLIHKRPDPTKDSLNNRPREIKRSNPTEECHDDRAVAITQIVQTIGDPNTPPEVLRELTEVVNRYNQSNNRR